MNLRLEVLRVQPSPTLKSRSTVLNQNNLFSLEENKERMLELLTTTCGQGVVFRTVLHLQGLALTFYCCQIQGLREGSGSCQMSSIFLSR